MSVKQIIFASRPAGMPNASTFQTAATQLSPLQPGELHLKGVYYSVDPYMRGRMNEGKSYIAPFEVGKPMEGAVVAEVLDSKAEGYHKGDLVMGGLLPWSTEMIVPATAVKPVDGKLAPPSYYLGLLGSPGLTAYCGLVVIGKPKPGETVLVSGAAGAVGLVAGQIAKILGCNVVGIAGTDDKITLLKSEYGFDDAINYKTSSDIGAAIARACPNGIDIYFDNVGGEITDAVFPLLNFQARVPVCGQIATYNDADPGNGPRILPLMLKRAILVQGFLIRYMKEHHAEALQHLSAWLKEDRLRFTETIVEGFDKLPEALLGLFSGKNTGKMVVKA